jgi:hypothetical protein
VQYNFALDGIRRDSISADIGSQVVACVSFARSCRSPTKAECVPYFRPIIWCSNVAVGEERDLSLRIEQAMSEELRARELRCTKATKVISTAGAGDHRTGGA